MKLNTFERVLRQGNYAENTVAAYLYAVRDYYSRYPSIDKCNLLEYRELLIHSYSPKTANLRMQALNKYLETIGKNELKIKFVKLQEESFLENIISDEEYAYLKNHLQEEPDKKCYFAIRFMAGTGARVSELLCLRVEHVRAGYFNVCSKGGKVRRLYIPAPLQKELLNWLDRESGYVFLNKYGKRITARGLSSRLTYYARKYGMNEHVVHPHAFRHLYAKKFLERYQDIALLADLLGHKNISTTRIYLRKSTTEQRKLINQIVDW